MFCVIILDMKIKYLKIKNYLSLILCLTLISIFTACATNPNSTLNKNPNEINNSTSNSLKPYDPNMIIDKDYGVGNKDIVIFSTNDSMSAYNENLSFAAIKHFYDNFDRKENYATLVDIGNFSSGNEIAKNSKGKSSIEIMNAMGYDIIVPGSHEFDYGLDTFYENMQALTSKVVCCNILDLKTKTLMFMPYVIFRYNGLNVAFVGVTSPETLFTEGNEDYFFDEKDEQILYFFEDATGEALYSQIQATVDAAREEGADKVILLAHLGVENVTAIWSSTSVISHTTGIDAVIDGHSMEVLESGLMTNKAGSFVPLVQAGSHLSNLAAMNITREGYIFPAEMSKNSIYTKDEKMQKTIDDIIKKYS